MKKRYTKQQLLLTALIFIILVSGFLAYGQLAYPSTVGNQWHSGNGVIIDVPGSGSMSLQQAVDQNLLKRKYIYFNTVSNPITNLNQWYQVPESNDGTAPLIGDWNAAWLEVTCDFIEPTSGGAVIPASCGNNCQLDTGIKTYGGLQENQGSLLNKRWNHQFIELSQYHEKHVYHSETYTSGSTTPVGSQSLLMRANGPYIEIMRQRQGNAEQEYENWECLIKVNLAV